MNPFEVGDVVKLLDKENIYGRHEGVITSISSCRSYLRFNNEDVGYFYSRYELVSRKSMKIVDYEEML